MPVKGKQKGNNFEIEVGQWLSWWITHKTRNDIFCRTVLSGGQFTATAKGQAGDLQPNDGLAFPFCNKFVIECKCWEYLYLIDFLNKKGDLYFALKKVQEQAEGLKKKWILIARQSRKPILAFFEKPITPFTLPYLSRIEPHFLWSDSICMVDFVKLTEVVPHEYFLTMYN